MMRWIIILHYVSMELELLLLLLMILATNNHIRESWRGWWGSVDGHSIKIYRSSPLLFLALGLEIDVFGHLILFLLYDVALFIICINDDYLFSRLCKTNHKELK